MASAAPDTLENIERRRVELEENVSKLRQALNHWSTWELEYEMLKEEIYNANDPSASQMADIGRHLGGKLVNEKEVQDILGKNPNRAANQVIDIISRRIDYVQQNISTVEKQLDAAEKKLAGASILLEPGMENDEGLPMMDIEEELDEDGNVISSSVSQPGKNAAEVVEAIWRAGAQKAEQLKSGSVKSSNDEPSLGASAALARTREVQSATGTSSSSSAPTTAIPQAVQPKKSVSFSLDTKNEPISTGRAALEATGYNDELADYNWTQGTKVIELDDDENQIASYPIIPEDESPEAATLRRQMLQYGLSEVGQVVAELDLDQPYAEYSDGDMDEAYDEYYDSEESEEEDQYGRNTRQVVSEEYKKKMAELEKKLNAKMLENVGPRPDLHPLHEFADDVKTLRVRKDKKDLEETGTAGDVPKASEPIRKGVRFADTLDISEVPETSRNPNEFSRRSAPIVPTMSDSIVERTSPIPRAPAPPSKPAKVSKFKSSRASQPPANSLPSPSVSEPLSVPTGPSGRILADDVSEHTPQPSEPLEPDEFDPVLINREIQIEYHKMRNKMIQQQAGFVPTEEDQDDPIMEERNGKLRKVSRFKAARLKADGI